MIAIIWESDKKYLLKERKLVWVCKSKKCKTEKERDNE